MVITNSLRLNTFQKEKICAMWNAEFPTSIVTTPKGFDDFLDSVKKHVHYIMTDAKDEIIAWGFTFDRDSGRWFSMIISGSHQHRGLGSLLLSRMKEDETRLNGWVVDHPGFTKQNGDAYMSPVAFYVKNGFTIVPGVRFEDAKLSAAKIEWLR